MAVIPIIYFPDIAVGSYASGHALLLRTRPVAQLSGHASAPHSLSLRDEAFTTTACVTYAGLGVPRIAGMYKMLTFCYYLIKVA